MPLDPFTFHCSHSRFVGHRSGLNERGLLGSRELSAGSSNEVMVVVFIMCVSCVVVVEGKWRDSGYNYSNACRKIREVNRHTFIRDIIIKLTFGVRKTP